MDDFENKTPVQTGANDLQAQFDALRHLVTSILILLVVMSGTLNIYLLRQWRTASKDLTGIRPQAAQMIAEYQKSGPLMGDFVKRITEYGRTHPDFAPVLAKYGLRPAASTSAAPAVPTASTRPPVASKK